MFLRHFVSETPLVKNWKGAGPRPVKQEITLTASTPRRAEKDWPPVVVASVFQTGLNLMRDLERRGIRVIGVDCEPDDAGFRSRYGRSRVCPNPDFAPAEWVAFMQSLSKEQGSKPVLIPAADIFVDALGRHADELEGYYNFSRDSVEVQAKLVTKEQQYALAARAGLPSPRFTYIESTRSLDEFCDEARFPCLLKPLTHRVWEAFPGENPLHGKKVVMADTAEQLRLLQPRSTTSAKSDRTGVHRRW